MILEKLEAHDDMGFCNHSAGPNDLVGAGRAVLRPRARSKTLFSNSATFLGRLPRNRVCAIHKGTDLELT
jgi:hypothetical protein